jgi:hypothetical protein
MTCHIKQRRAAGRFDQKEQQSGVWPLNPVEKGKRSDYRESGADKLKDNSWKCEVLPFFLCNNQPPVNE